MTIGECIRRARESKGVSLTELGRRMGTTASTIQRWEKNEVSPTWGTVERIASGLRISVVDLISQGWPMLPWRPSLSRDDLRFLSSLVADPQRLRTTRDLLGALRELPPETANRLPAILSQIFRAGSDT